MRGEVIGTDGGRSVCAGSLSDGHLRHSKWHDPNVEGRQEIVFMSSTTGPTTLP